MFGRKQCMLQHVRKGKNVAGLFYGHPGVFAAPPHRARKEVYTATLLPRISAYTQTLALIHPFLVA